MVDSNGKNLTDPVTYKVRGDSLKDHSALKSSYMVKLSTINENISKFCDSLNRLNIKIVVFTMDMDDIVDDLESKESGMSSLISLMNDYKQIFVSGDNSDLLVRTSDGNVLKLHKFPLITRSNTFNRMFNSDMSENESGVLEIKDFDSVVLTELFRFIYYNHVENLGDIDMELYKAAEKYLMQELKEKCLQSIFETIMKKDIIEVLEFADFHGKKSLFEYGASIFMM